MSKDEYLKEVEYLLSDLDEQDRNEAIDYYRNYFDDAGIENEENVIKTLGSPTKLAYIIRDSFNDDYDENIEIGDTGINNTQYEEKNELQNVNMKRIIDKGDKFIFLILLIAMCIPMTIFFNSIFGLAGILFTVIMFFFGFWLATIIFYVIGALFIAFGVFSLMSSLGAGLILIGTGFIIIVLGTLIGKVATWFFKSFLPYIYSKIKDIFNLLSNRRIKYE